MSTIKLLHLLNALGQGQSKTLAIIIRSMQCSNKNFSVNILTADKNRSTQHMRVPPPYEGKSQSFCLDPVHKFMDAEYKKIVVWP